MKKIGFIISLIFISIINTYGQITLTEDVLVEHYGKIRKDMALKACHYCAYNDQQVINLLTSKSVDEFKSALPKSTDIYNTICPSLHPKWELSGTEIDEYRKRLTFSKDKFVENLKYLNRRNNEIKHDIESDYGDFLAQIDSLSLECVAFNEDNAAYLKNYPDGNFVYLLKVDSQTEEVISSGSDNVINDSSKSPEEEILDLKAENAALKSEVAKLFYTWIITLLVLILLCAYAYLRKKKRNKRRNRTTVSKPASESTPASSPNNTPAPKAEPSTGPSSQLQTERFATENNGWIIVGASVIGRGHVGSGFPCQDSNSYAILGNGWGIAITSDGAGSAKHSHVGSKIVVTRAKVYFEQLILASSWYKNNTLPDDMTWSKTAFKAFKAVRDDMQKFAEDKQTKLESLAATAIVVVHTPMGLLVAHIGDGRAGYQDKSGAWHSLITPHKGEEANQTIFITSDFWNIPFYEMSGVSVPETRVIRESATSFVLMSDGCEHTSWDCNLYDADKGIYYDPNTPHVAFFNPLIETLKEHKRGQLPFADRSEKWSNYLDKGNKSFIKETDDKTMILGTIS